MAALGTCNPSLLGIYVVKAKNALTAQRAWWSRLRAIRPWINSTAILSFLYMFGYFWFLSRFCSSYVRHGRLGTFCFFFLLGFPCVPPLLPILPRLSGSQSWKPHRPGRTKGTWIPLRWASPWLVPCFPSSLWFALHSLLWACELGLEGLNVDLKVDAVV